MRCDCKDLEAAFCLVCSVLPQLGWDSGKNLEGFEIIVFTANLYGRRQLLPCSSAEGQRHGFSEAVLSMASSEQPAGHQASLCTQYTQAIHSETTSSQNPTTIKLHSE